MKEKIICESEINKNTTLILKCLLIIPAILMCIAISTGEPFDITWYPGWYMIFGILLAIIIGVLVFALTSCHIVVTDERVYGTAIFRQKIVLPLDMISAASTGLFGSVGVSTASGKIKFCFLVNSEELCSAISNLLIQRQENTKISENSASDYSTKDDDINQLKKYKDLLDSGVITQEDFEAKKKQLLGL